MEVIVLNKKTGEKYNRKYPRNDSDEIIGISNDYHIYGILEINKIKVDTKTHMLKYVEEWSDEPFNGNKYIKTYKRIYYSIKLSNELIINNLNESVGNWIDSNYPLWEQNKHTEQLLRLQIKKNKYNLDEYDTARFDWIINMMNWTRDCRVLRDYKEKLLLEQDIIPNFIWNDRPDKPEILNEIIQNNYD